MRPRGGDDAFTPAFRGVARWSAAGKSAIRPYDQLHGPHGHQGHAGFDHEPGQRRSLQRRHRAQSSPAVDMGAPAHPGDAHRGERESQYDALHGSAADPLQGALPFPGHRQCQQSRQPGRADFQDARTAAEHVRVGFGRQPRGQLASLLLYRCLFRAVRREAGPGLPVQFRALRRVGRAGRRHERDQHSHHEVSQPALQRLRREGLRTPAARRRTPVSPSAGGGRSYRGQPRQRHEHGNAGSSRRAPLMALKTLAFRPGVVKDASSIGAKPYWTDSDRVRSVRGQPRKLGGNEKNLSTTFTGICRGILPWLDNEGIARAALGTHLKFMVLDNNVFTDVTPIETSGTLVNPFTTTNGSPIVNVAHNTHGRNIGDYVHFSGAAAVGGITVNGEYTVTAFVDSNNYTITHSANATSTAGPGGGAAVAYQYEIGVGNVDGTQGSGYGVGTYGTGTYGTARSGYILLPPRTWSIDQWSDWIVACPRDGKIFQFVNDVGSRGTIITQAPFPNLGIWVTAEQHLVAFGAAGNKMEVD